MFSRMKPDMPVSTFAICSRGESSVSSSAARASFQIPPLTSAASHPAGAHTLIGMKPAISIRQGFPPFSKHMEGFPEELECVELVGMMWKEGELIQ
jgi:hypothetical protein